jgi:hypothetical protein
MRSIIIAAAIVSSLGLSGAALAQDPLTVKNGMLVTSADGKKLGRVYEVKKGADGAPTAIVVINDAKMATLAIGTLTKADNGVTTSLTAAEVRKLK